jgi:hypothetical protein
VKPIFWGLGLCAAILLTAGWAQDRNTKVLNDRDRVEASGFWIYNDLDKGFNQAKRTGKPLLVVFRCVPCAHCAQLDESLVERDKSVQKLLEQFVCVRVVHANGMDLTQFQFDYDQSWAAFLMNADRTIYGRYGTRSHQTESAEDMSLSGFGQALDGALALHRQYPKNKALFAAKRGPAVETPTPEQYPSLRTKYGPKLEFGPKVAQSCIHCHQVREAQRLVFRNADKPLPDSLMHPYPHPKTLGLIIDPGTRSTLKSVQPGSPAALAGFKTGDEIRTLEGQPILSLADIQWVLHHAPSTGSVKAEVLRGAKKVSLTLGLRAGWRQADNISWRASSWDLRRMVTGGLLLEDLPSADRAKLGLPADGLALRVKHVGEYGEHAAAKKAGFRKDDVVISVDGRKDLVSEGAVMAYLLGKPKGAEAPFGVVRSGNPMSFTIRMQ